MQSDIFINTIGCHAAGEVGEVIISGVPEPSGSTVWQKSRFLENNNELRSLLLHEPRGSLHKHMNLLLPPLDEKADFGWVIMEPKYNPPMSGSNAICVITVILETGMLAIEEPFKDVILEAPGGLLKARAHCKNGKVNRVEIENLPSFVYKRNVILEIPKIGSFKVNIVFGGDSFVLVEARDFGFSISPDEALDLVKIGKKITSSANEQIGFKHPVISGWEHISFCQFTLPTFKDEKGRVVGKNTVVIEPGKLDRSPCGTGCSARMALLHEEGKLKKSQTFLGKSILDTEFECRIMNLTKIGDNNGITPMIAGNAWITGHHTYLRDSGDPFQKGYVLSDTWPKSS